MTKLDYELIATAIRKSRHYVAVIEKDYACGTGGGEKFFLILLELLSSALEAQNPAFNRANFIRSASGWTGADLDQDKARSLLELAEDRAIEAIEPMTPD